MKGDIIRKVETEEYVQGKKKNKLVKKYTQVFVNNVLRVQLGVW